MLENGKTISSKAMARKSGRMELFTKGNIREARNRERAFLYGEMIAHTKDSFGRIISTVKENMFGRMAEFMKVNGITIKCMERVFLFGLMAESMKAHIKMIKSMDLGYLPSKMEEFTKDNGIMGSNMGGEYTRRKKL